MDAIRQAIRKLPFVRVSGHSTVPYHEGSVLENRLGLQVLRTVSKHLLFRARSRRITEDIREYVDALDRDGIVVIQDFLSPDLFRDTAQEFENAFADLTLEPYKGSPDARLYRRQVSVAGSPQYFPNIIKCFQENDMLNRIAGAVVKRKRTRNPDVFLDVYQKRNDLGYDNDIENILHADLHTSTVKMFFYLNDVNEMNGAFVYAKRSHKLTVSRMKHEYELSIRQAKSKRGMSVPLSLTATRGGETRNLIHPKYLSEMGVSETQICVRPNTLVIANNLGFHRRGEFYGDEPRKAILINFRCLERPFF